MLTTGLDQLISPRRMFALGILFYDTPISMVTLQLVQSGGGGRKGVGVAQENPPSPTKKIAIRFFGSIPEFS